MHTEEVVTKLRGLCTKRRNKNRRGIFFRRIELQLEEGGLDGGK